MIKPNTPQGCGAVAALLLALTPAAPVHGAGFTETDLWHDIPTVSAAARFEQRLERAPASITVIDRDLIRLSGAQSFVDIFRLVPGFQAYHVGNNRYGISYHGLGREFPNQIEVMVNGRSVYETLFSSVNWSTLGIAITDIDYIEVVRGSNAAAQGSNAFMGSINIVTRKPFQEEGLMVETTLGDLRTRNALVRYSDRMASLDYRVSIGYQKNNGFPATPAGPLDDGRELAFGNGVAIYTPTLLDTVEVSMGYARDRIGWGDADHPDEFSLAKSYNSYQSGKWTRLGDGDDQYQVHVYHSHFRTSNFDGLGPLYGLLDMDPDTVAALTAVQPVPPQVVAGFAAATGLESRAALALLNELNSQVYGGFGRLESERYDIQFQHTYALSDSLRGAWGVGARYDRMSTQHPQSYDMDIEDTSLRFYSHGEWRATDRLTLNAGAMVEDSLVGTLVSPRLSANYQLAPRHTVRFAGAIGNRAPSLLEANENSVSRVGDVVFDILRVADPDLHEEHLESVEVAYLFQSADARLNLDVRLFSERISDVIDEVLEVPPATATVFGDNSLKRIENAGSWQFTGGEMQLGYRLSDATFLRLHYTNVDMDSRVYLRRSPEEIWFNKDDRMARHSGSALIGHHFSDSLSASVLAYHQSGLRWEDGDTLDSFTRIDAQIAYGFAVGGLAGSVRLVAQNIGEDYSEFNDNNVFETRYFLVAQVEL